MAEAARLEPLWAEYQDQDVAFMGIDVYDGNPDQVDLLFRQSGRTSFPLLLAGSTTVRAFKSGIERVVVIDHQGIVQYHAYGVSGREKIVREILEEAVTAAAKAVQEAVAAADEVVQEEMQEEVTGPIEASWGGIKEKAANIATTDQ